MRDKGSATLLADWKIPFTLAPDPVWALETPRVGLVGFTGARVAVCLRSHSTLTPASLSILTQALVDFQKATRTLILLLPFQASHDFEIAKHLHEALPKRTRILSLDDPRKLKGVFRGVEMAIGMRYHSLIMAASEQRTCFALSYDPKVSQLMEELEMPGYLSSESPYDPDLISKTCIEHHANGDA